MLRHADIADAELRRLIRSGAVTFAGNLRLKIFGRLDCGHGRRMKRENRVFFASEAAAREAGFRPCGHCMRGS